MNEGKSGSTSQGQQRSVTIADHFGAEQRTKSVGCNQTLARKRAAILGRHHNAIATIFEAVHHGVGHKFNRISIPASIEQCADRCGER